jgi:prepilin peptidase CpaA
VELGFLFGATAVTAVAAWTDARTGIIPNWLTLGALGIAPGAHVVFGLYKHQVFVDALARGGYSLVGALCALVPLYLFKRGAMGGGDVKLFAAVGALCGFEAGLNVVLHSFFIGAIGAIAMVIYQGRFLQLVKNLGTVIANFFRSKARRKTVAEGALTSFRMGPAIFLAVCLQAFVQWRWR